MARILVDLDGPAYPFFNCAKNYIDFHHAEKWDTTHPPDEYGFFKAWGMTGEEFTAIMVEASRAGHLYRSLPPVEGFVDALIELRRDGHEIVIVTARRYDQVADEAATRWWLNEYDVPYDELIFSSEKTGFDTQYSIEDYTKNARALAEAGVHSFIIDRPWNEDWDGDRVGSWPEFVGEIKRAEFWKLLERKPRDIVESRIVGISGYAGAGKDTLGAILVEKYGFERASFADPLRTAVELLNPIVGYEDSSDGRGGFNTRIVRYNDALDQLGYTEAKVRYPEVRRVLQAMGTEVGRNFLDADLWVNLCVKSMDPEKKYVVTDARFPNEAECIRRAGGILVRIEREGYGPVNDHPSETALDGYAFDIDIKNDGSIADLEAVLD
jgi:hypothetical protein